jgi:Excalibur calcium-binding domain
LRAVGCGRKVRAVNRFTALAAASAMLLAVPASAAIGSTTAIPRLYKNCTNLNKRYPHGLGRVGARDHTSGTPVTNFKRGTKPYKLALSYNRGLDRDKDGIACEKA